MNFHACNFRKIFSPRALTVVVGIILLIAAVLKGCDIELFMRQIKDYQIITNPLLILIGAWGLIIAEFVLGASLVICYYPKITISLTIALFCIFIGATLWALITGVTEDCGCFGSWVERSPGGAIIEDLFMLGALLLSWPDNNYLLKDTSRIKPVILVAALMAGMAMPVFFGAPVKELFAVEAGEDNGGEDLFELQGLEDIDLKNGSFLFVLMGTDCLHCRDSVGDFNKIASKSELPKVITLTPDDDKLIDAFKEELNPIFPVVGITEDDFYRLMGMGLTPRSILVVKQYVIKTWDKEIPTATDIKQALGP